MKKHVGHPRTAPAALPFRLGRIGRIGLLGLIALLAFPPLAHAQNGADKAAADTLFQEGKRLIADGSTEAACAKFEASLAKLTQLGAQLALASCYEALGKTASAWGEFRAAASAAGKARDSQRKRFAEGRATQLEAKLSRLAIKVEPGYRIDDLQVIRDGLELSAAELGTPVPVDPGEHIIEAKAPGWVAWSKTVMVEPLPGVVEVIVPALGKAPVKVEEAAPAPTSMEVDAGDGRDGSRRRLAYWVGGGGLAVIGTSLIFGAVASSKWSSSQDHCIDGRCDQEGVELADSAGTFGTLSTATFLVGTAAVAAGAYLWFTSRSRAEENPAKAAALRLVPTFVPSAVTDGAAAQVGLTLHGGF